MKHYISTLALAGAMAASSLALANAQDNHINIDIGRTFDWSADSINKVAESTGKVFRNRCDQPCTIKVRVFVDKKMDQGVSKRLIWLKNSIEKEMRRRSGQHVTVYDAIHIS